MGVDFANLHVIYLVYFPIHKAIIIISKDILEDRISKAFIFYFNFTNSVTSNEAENYF